jgi:hypothetical protein
MVMASVRIPTQTANDIKIAAIKRTGRIAPKCLSLEIGYSKGRLPPEDRKPFHLLLDRSTAAAYHLRRTPLDLSLSRSRHQISITMTSVDLHSFS